LQTKALQWVIVFVRGFVTLPAPVAELSSKTFDNKLVKGYKENWGGRGVVMASCRENIRLFTQ
jgi:hypothetical protein